MRHLFILIAIVSFGSAAAQRPMSFDEALSEMLTNSRILSGARYGVDIAKEEVRAAEGLRFPRIDIVGTYALMQHDISVDLGGAKGIVTKSLEDLISKGVGTGIITPDIATLLGTGLSPLMSANWSYTLQKRSFGTLGATLSVPIYAGGRINIANRAAKLRHGISTERLNATENKLLTELVERYYGVVLARSVVELCREVVEGVDKHLSDALAMEQEGLIPHSVILYLHYQKSEAERMLTDAENRLKITRYALSKTIGTDVDINPNSKLFVHKNMYNIDYYINASLELNPIIAEADKNLDLAKEGVKLSRADLLPEVIAMGGSAIYSNSLSSMIPRWAVGVGLRVPIFDGLSKERRYRAAKLQREQVGELVENARSEIGLLVEKEYYGAINALANIEACRRSISFAKSYLNSASEGFVEGVVSAADLMDARVQYSAAQTELLNAAYDYVVSLARLLEASGLSTDFVNYLNTGCVIEM